METRKHLLAVAAILTGLISIQIGIVTRSRLEAGPGMETKGAITLDNLVSTSDEPLSISESQMFYQLSLLLEKEYVDTIQHDMSLASGAIRGMVTSLTDSKSQFFDKDAFTAHLDRLNGTYAGIGVELELSYNEEELAKLQRQQIGLDDELPEDGDANFDRNMLFPEVIVRSVMPGSPGEQAGLVAGDRILKINDRWTLASTDIERLTQEIQKIAEAPNGDEEFEKLRNAFIEMADNSIPVGRALKQLVEGDSGSVELIWLRDGQEMTASLEKSVVTVDPIYRNGSTQLRFFKGAAEELKELIAQSDGDLVLDLRQSGFGDYQTMLACLDLVSPSGQYGVLDLERAGEPRAISSSADTSLKSLRLIVDHSVVGAAAIFAKALSSTGWAKIEGDLISDDLAWVESIELPTGEGYTLRTGMYKTDEQAGEARS